MPKKLQRNTAHHITPFVSPGDASDLRSARRLDPERIHFSISREEIAALDDGRRDFTVIGQPRALRALHLSAQVRSKGYNLFVTGLPGTGRRTAVLKVLEEYREDLSRVRDIAYVFNFRHPDRPTVLYFSPGKGVAFRDALKAYVEQIGDLIEEQARDEGFKDHRDQKVVEVEGRENIALSDFEERLKADGFAVVKTGENDQADIAPIIDGTAYRFEELQELLQEGKVDQKTWTELRERYYRYVDEMSAIYNQMRSDRVRVEKELRRIRLEGLRPMLEKRLEPLKKEFDSPEVIRHLDGMLEDILEQIELFVPPDPDRDRERDRDEPAESPGDRYAVNVVVDHSETTKAPLIMEIYPDAVTLFGSQDQSPDHSGESRPGHLGLRAGSVAGASGGFLVLRAEDVLTNEDLWHGLKRTILEAETEIRSAAHPLGPPAGALKPDPIKVDIKLVLLGNDQLYDYLYMQDEEFGKLFKVPAEFDSVMPRNDRTTREYIRFIRMVEGDERLLPFDHDAIAAILEHSVRLAELRDKLSTRFSHIADIMRESNHWTRQRSGTAVTREDVIRAQEERRFLYNLPEEKIDEQILSGELLISVNESSVGRINGLAIVDRGYYAFARPVLITARTAPGDDGIINIERESGLSGEIHDKGIYILQGFLQSKYTRDFPLSVRASLCFEQSYVEVDGDSASAAEVYALLSAIADVPMRQDIAVTGSVNQMGQIQPVGGISEKIEGFFDICSRTELTGRQGVIIPEQNVSGLILRKEVQDAIAEGRFSIYTVKTIDEGIEILTGRRAGDRTPKGTFEAGTVNAEVERRLHQMALSVKNFGGN
ncbi:MAG: AAA family ATPase [Spirochaetaceae bacterium]